MTIVNKEFYTIDSHPDKTAVYEYIREEWNNLECHTIHDLYKSLQCFCNIMGVELSKFDVHNRQIRINIKGYILLSVFDLHVSSNYLTGKFEEMTGSFWDEVILDVWTKSNYGGAALNKTVLDMLDSEIEHIYSDSGLYDLCMANQYYFDIDGQQVSI